MAHLDHRPADQEVAGEGDVTEQDEERAESLRQASAQLASVLERSQRARTGQNDPADLQVVLDDLEDDDDTLIDLRTDGAAMSELPPLMHGDGAPATAWVSVAEAAEKSGVGTSTVRQWYRSGRVPTQRAEGERGAFLVPLHAVLALAQQADEEGDAVGAELIDLNASYWSAQTEAAREEATAARNELSQARVELAELESELVTAQDQLIAAQDQLGFLRSQLAEASEDTRAFREQVATANDERDRHRVEATRLQAELTHVQDELDEAQRRLAAQDDELRRLRSISSATASITDNSWLDLGTNAYQSPVRPQGMAAATPAPSGDAFAGLLADTQADELDRSDLASDADGADRERLPTLDEERAAAAEAAALEAPTPVVRHDFGRHDDDLLPEPEKKGRRGRK